jgi:phage tail sheath protein FI
LSAQHTYPGVYVEELPSAVRTIIGVQTSVTAFIGRALKGPVDKAMLIHNFGDYERVFGGLWKKSNLSYAVYQFYQNGGVDAVIVRVAMGAQTAMFADKNNMSPVVFQAASPGKWGEDLRIVIEDASSEKKQEDKDDTYFNIIVRGKEDAKGKAGPILETLLNVSMKPDSPSYIEKVIADGGLSTYLRVDATSIPANSPAIPSGASYTLTGAADDGTDITDPAVIKGSEEDKTGMYALKNADIFNLLCIPSFTDDPDKRQKAYDDALEFCNQKRAILVLDPPLNWVTKQLAVDDIKQGKYITRDKNSALFFPKIKAADPLDNYLLKEFDPCGVVAGVIARTDAQRGVWKAPAGIEATLIGVPDLAIQLTNDEIGELNPKGINCLRTMSDAGRVVWGSRTLKGADSLADQWKYLPVRRMALFIEETLYRATQWVVFEPNDEKLWAQIRLNVGAFMHSLFIKGAFQGTDPKKAYLVKCDNETTTQDDINSGIVNILVGFAPLKPAEFVIIKIQQLAGQVNE